MGAKAVGRFAHYYVKVLGVESVAFKNAAAHDIDRPLGGQYGQIADDEHGGLAGAGLGGVFVEKVAVEEGLDVDFGLDRGVAFGVEGAAQGRSEGGANTCGKSAGGGLGEATRRRWR